MPAAIRDDTRELEALIAQLADQASVRPATSPGEARAAAFVNGRLRRAGMGVSAYELRAATQPGGAYLLVGGLACLATILTPLLPLPSFLLAVSLLLLLLIDSLGPPIPPIGPRRASQNIIGTRAIEGAAGLFPATPRWRIILLAPLDSPTIPTRLALLVERSRQASLIRLAIVAIIVAGAAAALWLPGRWWLVGLPGGLGALLLIIAASRPTRPHPADGGLAALATMLAVAERIEHLSSVELWAVAVGAASSDPRGVVTLLTHFPFDQRQTFFIALEQLVGAQLIYVTDEGSGGKADRQLVSLAEAAAAADPLIRATPQPRNRAGLLAAPLRRYGYSALTIRAYGSPSLVNPLPVPDPELVERTTRLVVGMIRRLDGQPDAQEPFAQAAG